MLVEWTGIWTSEKHGSLLVQCVQHVKRFSGRSLDFLSGLIEFILY